MRFYFKVREALHAWLSVALIAASLAAQPLPLSVPDGFASEIQHTEPGNPFALRALAIDPANATLYLSINNRVLRQETNGALTELFRFPQNESTGLFSICTRRNELIFTNFKTSRCYRRDLQSGLVSSFSGVKNAYDVGVTLQGDVLVTANPDWPNSGARTSVYVLDPLRGKHREIIQLAGPSGPLLITPSGDLLYAVQSDQYPTPRGSVRVLLFTQTQVTRALAGTTPLPLTAGKVVLAGLDGASDLCMDGRGRVYISDSQHGGILRTKAGSYTLEPTAFSPPSNLVTLGLAFADLGAGSMDSYQAAEGASLYVHTTDWRITAEARRVTPLRPRLSASPNPAPKGPVQINIQDAPPDAQAWLGISILPALPERPVFREQGVLLFLGLDFMVPPLLLSGRTNATGSLGFRFTNPGQFLLTLSSQCLIGASPTPCDVRIGTSNPCPIHIRP